MQRKSVQSFKQGKWHEYVLFGMINQLGRIDIRTVAPMTELLQILHNLKPNPLLSELLYLFGL